MQNHTQSCSQPNLLLMTQTLLVCLATVVMMLSSINLANAEEKPLVEISNHWVRATHPGQTVGAAYMTFNSREDVKLTHVSANVTKAVEVHEMKMVNNIMKMRQLESLSLVKGQAVSLKPGGLHLMLFDLAKPLKAGETIHFELCFTDKSGNITIIPLTSEVKAAGHH